MKIKSITSLSQSSENFNSNDTLILFGELFPGGYANGLVQEAQKKGMKIIYSTVGRRDENQKLRPLNEVELTSQSKPFINIPLECGFDLEPSLTTGQTPVELCKSIGLKEGIQAKLPTNLLEECRNIGRNRFRKQVQEWIQAITPHCQPGKKILIAHLMAGGVPRSKIIFSLMNRVFKGSGDRHISSNDFWESDLGKFCQMSFMEVTAESFNILIEETANLRDLQAKNGGSIHYSAYGYHGTEIFYDRKLQWLTYTPYIQGFAKKKLEDYACEHWKNGVRATVYNCPEILTQSSSIFPGVEIFLYTLYFELRHRTIICPLVNKLLDQGQNCFTKENLEIAYELIGKYLRNPLLQETLVFDEWPKHSHKALMELTLKTSDDLVKLHKDPNNLLTSSLSEIIITAAGTLMLRDLAKPQFPVIWVGHDAVANEIESGKSK